MLQVNYFHCPRNYWWTNENDLASSAHRKLNKSTEHSVYKLYIVLPLDSLSIL